MKLQDSNGGILCRGVLILDASGIEDYADYGGMLYKIKKLGIREGEAYQIDNAGDLLMYRNAYNKCKHILEKFGAKVVSD